MKKHRVVKRLNDWVAFPPGFRPWKVTQCGRFGMSLYFQTWDEAMAFALLDEAAQDESIAEGFANEGGW